MERLLLLLLLLMILIDTGLIRTGRNLLLDFLRGATSNKEYKDIHAWRKKGEKLSLSYILDYIRYEPDIKVFKKYRALYKACFIYVIIVFVPNVCLLFLCELEVFLYLQLIITLPKVIMFTIFEQPTWPNQISLYAKKPEERYVVPEVKQQGKQEDEKKDGE